MNRTRQATCVAATILAAALAACGGGGGGSSPTSSVVPAATPSAAAGTGQATFRIDTGSGGTTAVARKTQYISPATQSVTIAMGTTPLATVNLTPASSQCTTTPSGTSCAITIAVPLGQDTFTVSTFSGLNGAGSTLSTSTVTFDVVSNATNTIPMALNGVVATATAILGTSALSAGVAASTTVSVAAYDATGNLIIGPGNYSSPITLTDSDTSGATHLSATQITGPTGSGSTVTLSYTGASLLSATITPSVGTVRGTAATFTASGYSFTPYTLSNAGDVEALAAGYDGNMWYANDGAIGWIATNGSASGTFTSGVPTTDTYALAAGSGEMWFGNTYGDIGTITSAGQISSMLGITVVPAGCNDESEQDTSIARRSQGRRTIEGGFAFQTCGPVNWMTLGPDGNIWFTDDWGYIGVVTPGLIATEWDITQLPGWPNDDPVEPGQFTFVNGAIYISDDAYIDGTAYGSIDQITLSGDAAQSVTRLDTGGCGGGGIASLNGYIYAASDAGFGSGCDFITVVPAATFATTTPQQFDLTAITNDDPLYIFGATANDIFGNDYTTPTTYRISNFSTGQPAPVITTFDPFGSLSGVEPFGSAVGPDGDIWVAAGLDPDTLVKTAYGSVPAGSQSVKRLTPMALRAHGPRTHSPAAAHRRYGAAFARLTGS